MSASSWTFLLMSARRVPNRGRRQPIRNAGPPDARRGRGERGDAVPGFRWRLALARNRSPFLKTVRASFGKTPRSLIDGTPFFAILSFFESQRTRVLERSYSHGS